MTYRDTLQYLYEQLPMYHRVGGQAYKADLDNTIALCDLLGNPQQNFRSVHIAGTNGKGSVSHMLASVLQEAGYRTGLYTSPHLKDFRERIRVNGRMIGKKAVTAFVKRHREACSLIRPSFFEWTVAMAFDYFREENVEIAVVETGMGGRLDSTNIITPLLSVITQVSFDHMQFLGDTLEKIAQEKAGIIKPGIPAVVGETQAETREVFETMARSKGSELVFADRIFSIGSFKPGTRPGSPVKAEILFMGRPWLEEVSVPLTGQYQRKNLVTLAATCMKLREAGLDIGPGAVCDGIRHTVRNTGLAGRWQVIGRNPLTICDTAHNEGGLREILPQILQTPHKRLHIVFGVVSDKHLEPILAMLPRHAAYYFCRPAIPRGLDAPELQEQASRAGLHGTAYHSVAEALAIARRDAGKEDLVFVGGSTFVVAEVV